MTAGQPPSMRDDSRGVLSPSLMLKRSQVSRHPAGAELAGVVDWFWAASWSLPAGMVHTQPLLTHPCGNISVSHGEAGPDGREGPVAAMVHGVVRTRGSRRLGGTGWAAAAKTTCGGLGALIGGPASALTGQSLPAGSVLPVDEQALVGDCLAAEDEQSRIGLLRDRLLTVVRRADPARVRSARDVAEIGRCAELDRTVRTVEHLASRAGVSVRTLQRLFGEYVGAPPLWVLRRYRLMDVAELVRTGQQISWSEVAADLGYSDQAHLVRDFKGATGTTPAAYAQAQEPLPPLPMEEPTP